MPISLEIADLSSAEVIPLTCYSFRVTVSEDEAANYISYIKKYLERLKIIILGSSAGFHSKASKPHFHYHLLVSEPDDYVRPVKAKMNQHFKDFLKLKIHAGLAPVPAPRTLGIEIRDDQDWDQTLGYPLKEKQPLLDGCHKVNVQELMEVAHEIFKNAKPTKQEKKEKDAELAHLCHEYLDQNREHIWLKRKELDQRGIPFIWREGAYREAIIYARKFYVDHKVYTPNTPCSQAMKWLNKTGMLSDDDLISMYSPLGRLRNAN